MVSLRQVLFRCYPASVDHEKISEMKHVQIMPETAQCDRIYRGNTTPYGPYNTEERVKGQLRIATNELCREQENRLLPFLS